MVSSRQMRRPVIAGNWKMYKTIAETRTFVDHLMARVAKVGHCEIIIAPPYTALRVAREMAHGSALQIAGQDVHWESEGAHTGDVSAGMLLEAGCTHVIVGHSERRRDHGEDDKVINRKLRAALAVGLIPIVCVGETLDEREAGGTQGMLDRQFQRGFSGLTASQFSRIIIAYEPVWAIGTGKTATPEMAAESHGFLRKLSDAAYGRDVAEQLRIIYGGSVKATNIAGLMAQDEIDGALVGGASLEIESFMAIVNYSENSKTV